MKEKTTTNNSMITMGRNEKTSMQYRKICIFCGKIYSQDTNFKFDKENNAIEGQCNCPESIKLKNMEREDREEYIEAHRKIWYIKTGKHNEHIIVGRRAYTDFLFNQSAERMKNKLEMEEKQRLREIEYEKYRIENQKRSEESAKKEAERIINRDKVLGECTIKELVSTLIYINKRNNIIGSHEYYDGELDCGTEDLDKEIEDTLGKAPYGEYVHESEIYAYIENNLDSLLDDYVDKEIEKRRYEESMDE